MRSSSAPSPPEPPASGEETVDPVRMPALEADLDTMRRRFIEALRRAEIIALVNAADDEPSLGAALTDELCEAFDAEISFLGERVGQGGEGRLIAAVGLPPEPMEVSPVEAEECARALEREDPVTAQGDDLFGLGAVHALLSRCPGRSGRDIVLCVARTYDVPFDRAEVGLMEAVAESVAHALDRIWAHEERERLLDEIKASFLGTAEALANALEAKDYYTAGHAREIADLAVAAGMRLGLDDDELEDLRYGATFHDIGKIAIPEGILNKPGALSDEERELVRRHTVIGEEIIAPVGLLAGARPIVRSNHERWDGSGYPDALAGEEIPIGARIVAVVDSYHAMTSDRAYHAAIAPDEAIAELRRSAGSQFDPRVVNAVVELLEDADAEDPQG